jgi:class 3 adenylate cyclase
MTKSSLSLPFLSKLVPSGLNFGANYVVEFESQSLWYETSLTLAAQALRSNIRTDYHTFTHVPGDIRKRLDSLGLEMDKLESEDIFRIWDSYTIQTGAGEPEKVGKVSQRDFVDTHSLNLDDWSKADINMAQEKAPDADMGRLHIDDDTSILLHFNDERKFLQHFRTQTVPFARKNELCAFHAVLSNVFSESFYKQFESFCDGIFDFKSEEKEGKLMQYARARVVRAISHDSSWHQLRILKDGEVAFGARREQPKLSGSMVGSSADKTVHGTDSRRLAAVMFTDIVDYTALSQRNEALALRLLEEQRRVVRNSLSKHGGTEVKTVGDGFLLEFGSALDAVKCALDFQKTFHESNERKPLEKRILIRAGIHIGDVVVPARGRQYDLLGDAVNIASRIEPLASPGGICVSEQVYYQVKNKIDIPMVSLGAKTRLKNVVETPTEVFKLEIPWQLKETQSRSRRQRKIGK